MANLQQAPVVAQPQCPCGLTQEQLDRHGLVGAGGVCTAFRKGSRTDACGELLADHPHTPAVPATETVKIDEGRLIALLEQQQKDTQALTTGLQALTIGLANAEIRRLRQQLDCWHSNARTIIESSVFKDSLAVFYGCTRTVDTDLKCMLTGNFYPRHEVRASHIIKRSTDGDTMHLYGLPPNVDHVRNGLLLLEPIEQLFDRKDLCFLYSPITNQLVAKVLNPSLMTEQMPKSQPRGATYSMTYGSVDGLVLQLPSGTFPYRRALSMHAKFAFSRALHFNWIADSEILESYFNVSDNGLQEPLGLGLLDWKEVHLSIHNTMLTI